MARTILVALMVLVYPFHFESPLLWMFTHVNLPHLILNAITLWSFAKPVEAKIGTPRMLSLFFIAGFAGIVSQQMVTPGMPVLGASAGIFGLIAAFVVHHPAVRIGIPVLMFPSGPVLFALLTASVVCLMGDWLPQIAHMAHITGIFVGAMWSTWPNDE